MFYSRLIEAFISLTILFQIISKFAIFDFKKCLKYTAYLVSIYNYTQSLRKLRLSLELNRTDQYCNITN